jgi:hypothetical protein
MSPFEKYNELAVRSFLFGNGLLFGFFSIHSRWLSRFHIPRIIFWRFRVFSSFNFSDNSIKVIKNCFEIKLYIYLVVLNDMFIVTNFILPPASTLKTIYKSKYEY